jgi:DNA-binding transcriptional regulator of glucitol operon
MLTNRSGFLFAKNRIKNSTINKLRGEDLNKMDFGVDKFGVFFLLLAVMWIIQFGLTYFQMRRFYGRMVQLKRNGLTAVGLCGNQYKGRTYAVLTIDEDNRVIHAESFGGWTVFATLKPVPEMQGMTLDDILANPADLPVSNKLQTAFSNAATDLKHAREEQPISTDDNPAIQNMPVCLTTCAPQKVPGGGQAVNHFERGGVLN